MMYMKVKIEKVDWFLSKEIQEGTVTFSVNGIRYNAFSQGSYYPVGETIDVIFSHIDGPTTWEDRFSKNYEKEKKLIAISKWSYEGYGEIISINPLKADFGDIILDLGEWSHDENIIGEFIYWKISRLDILPKTVW